MDDPAKPTTPDAKSTSSKSTLATSHWWKWTALALAVVGALAVYFQFGESLSIQALAKRESELRAFQNQHPILIYGAAFLIYVLVTGLSLPGAAVLTLVFGWYFGMWRGLLLVSFASTTGATMAFLLSRLIFRERPGMVRAAWVRGRRLDGPPAG